MIDFGIYLILMASVFLNNFAHELPYTVWIFSCYTIACFINPQDVTLNWVLMAVTLLAYGRT